MLHAVGLILFGSAVGLLSGLLGIGGGIILVPGLVLLFGLTQAEAQGTSLAVLMLPVVGFAAMVYYRNGDIRVANVAMLADGFMGGAFLGASLLPKVPVAWLRTSFGFLLLYVAFLFLMDARQSPLRAALPAAVAGMIAKLFAYRRRSPPAKETEGNADDPPAEYHI